MPRAAPAGAKKRAAPKSARLAEQLPQDTILKDVLKKSWRLGDVIGQGGFGLVYHANTEDALATSDAAQYVIKIEPGSSGPLFCEVNFYMRAAKKEFIEQFIRSHKLKYLPVPPYIGCGIYNTSYRFLVMPRYGTDLQKLLREAGGVFPSATVFAVGLRMIDALQFLHEREYVHADIKASNILLGFNGRSEIKDQVYLADYGLAYRYRIVNEHRPYKPDPKNAHNGSIEFTSRDAHRGANPSRRGDIEILGFCLLQWLCGKLPWESNLTNPTFVAQEKEKYMMDLNSLMTKCFSGKTNAASESILQFLESVADLEYEDVPDYKGLKEILRFGLTKAGQKDEWKINFPTESKGTKRKSQGTASPRASPKKAKSINGSAKASLAPKKPKSPAPKQPKSPVSRKGKTSPPKKTKPISPSKRTLPVPSKSPLSKVTDKVPASPLRKGSASSAKRKSVSPKASPLSAVGKQVFSPLGGVRSPLNPSPLVVSNGTTRSPRQKQVPATRPKKPLQIPPPSKPSPKKSPATGRKKAVSASTVRRVRRTPVTQTDASIQTTPTLKDNI